MIFTNYQIQILKKQFKEKMISIGNYVSNSKDEQIIIIEEEE